MVTFAKNNKIMQKLFLYILVAFLPSACLAESKVETVAQVLRKGIMRSAKLNMKERPITITDYPAQRSAGGLHDFYSEGDYWWPNPADPNGKYIRRDGESNPDNFTAHRHAMIRLSQIVATLTSAYLLTGDTAYVRQVENHVRAWFITPATMMLPNLCYAQAIKGVATGRGIGIIDTIHLIEVAQSLLVLHRAGVLHADVYEGTRQWFADYLQWLLNHPYGRTEMHAANNHGTCWALQAAVFARYAGNPFVTSLCLNRFQTILMPQQMASDGSFPMELKRTKPFAYSLFNLDAMSALAEVLTDSIDNEWQFTLADGRNMRLAIDFMYPFIVDKSQWKYGKDVMYWREWPVAQPSLLFAWLQYGDQRYFDLWRRLDHFPTNAETVRNLPVRNPLIWITDRPIADNTK